MLRITRLMASAKDVTAYLMPGERDHSRADYYSRNEGVGRWGGRIAERLGLAGDVDRCDFEAVAGNRHPASGDRLTPRDRPGRRAGFDVCFSAPKSVSLLWAATQDREIRQALKRAAETTMKLMERDAGTRVRTAGQYKDRRSGEMVWASFLHHTSRPTADAPPDPQLHVHAFVMNVTWDPVEARFKALQPERFHRSAGYYEAIFHTCLAAGIQALGYPIVREGRKGWEIEGVSRALIERFSARTRQIEAKAAALGVEDAEARAGLGASTRLKKARGAGIRELHKAWMDRMSRTERRALIKARRRPTAPAISAEAALDHAMAHCFERGAVIEDRRLIEAALRHGVGSVDLDGIEQAMAARPWLSQTDEAERVWLSTPAVLAEERAMCRFAREGRGRCDPLHDADRAIAPRAGITLNAEQQAACRHVWSSPDRVMAVRGAAGSGKTAMIREAVAGIEAGGRRVVALAPSASASRGVLREAGIRDADTVAMFLHDATLREKARSGVIWVDEASLVGTRALAKVFEAARELDARVVLSGDPMQHKAVERGEPLRVLEKHAGVRPIEVSRILRQRGAYREAVEALSRGDAAGGLKRLERMGAVIELEGERRFEAIAEDYVRQTAKGKDVLVVSPTHGEGGTVTRAIRARLRQTGRLAGDERQRPCYSDLQWTEAQRGDPANYEGGQRVYFHQHAPGIRAGTWWDVAGKDHTRVHLVSDDGKSCELPLSHAGRFSVYHAGTFGVAKGDLVRCTKNTHDAGRRRAINNGSTFRVAGFNPRNGNTILKPLTGRGARLEVAPDNGLFTYGYCTTSHAAQGRTVDEVLICQGAESLGAASARQLYVSVSRGRESVRLYTDDRATLHRAAADQEALRSAHDLADGGRQGHPGIDPDRDRALGLARWRAERRQAFDLAERARTVARSVRRSVIRAFSPTPNRTAGSSTGRVRPPATQQMHAWSRAHER